MFEKIANNKELMLLIILSDRTGRVIENNIPMLLDSDINWKKFIELGWRHKLLLPSINELIKYKPKITEQLINQISIYRNTLNKKNIVNEFETKRIIYVLNQNNIDVFPMKGVELAKALYGNIYDRMTHDIDIIIHSSNIKKAIEKLNEIGYKLISPYNQFNEKQLQYTYIHNKHIGLYNSSKEVLLEIHWKLISLNFTPKIFNILDAKDKSLSISNGLSPEILLYLMIHGTSHLYTRIFWLRDIYHIAVKFPDITSKAIEMAYNLKLSKIINITFGLIDHFFDFRQPELIDFNKSKKDKDLVNYCKNTILNNSNGPRLQNTIKLIWFLQSLKRNIFFKLEVLKYIIFIPEDQGLFKLPANLVFLNYPLSPIYRLLHYFDIRKKWLKTKDYTSKN